VSFAAAFALAVLHGTCKAEVGVSIQHDANHGAYGNNRTWMHAMQLTLDVVGASSFMWKQQHVAGHHAYTNVEGIDPDIRCSEKDVRRVNEHQPHEPYHAVTTRLLGVDVRVVVLQVVLRGRLQRLLLRPNRVGQGA